jgi:hypothetical protein
LNRVCQRCDNGIRHESYMISPWCCGHGMHVNCFVRFHRRNHQEHCPLCGNVMIGRRNNNNVVFVVPRNFTGRWRAPYQNDNAVAAGGDPEPPSVPAPALTDVVMSAPPSAQPASESVDVSGSRQSTRLRRPPRASGIVTVENEIAVTIDAMVRGPRPVNGMRTLRTA